MDKDMVQVEITAKTAAKLIVSGELDAVSIVNKTVAKNVLEELINIPVEELICVVDCNLYGTIADVARIPQCGYMETIMKVPYYFVEKGDRCVDSAQLGLYLKKDPTATLSANTKYGENHGKAAAAIGLICMKSTKFIPSSLTYAYCDLCPELQMIVLQKMMFRIPIIQILLKEAKNRKINGYSPMAELSASTRVRRGLTVRAILYEMGKLNNAELKERIQNIYWDN